MSQENVETVRRIFDAWEGGDVSVGASDLDPDVIFIIRPPMPDAQRCVGREGVIQYFTRFLEFWKHLTLEAERFRWAGDTVVVKAILRGEGTKSGVDVEGTYFMLLTFRGRNIIRIESIVDEAEALEAAGLSE